MNTTMNIHNITGIEVGVSRKLSIGTWVRDITFPTETGKITVTCFSDDILGTNLRFGDLDD